MRDWTLFPKLLTQWLKNWSCTKVAQCRVRSVFSLVRFFPWEKNGPAGKELTRMLVSFYSIQLILTPHVTFFELEK